MYDYISAEDWVICAIYRATEVQDGYPDKALINNVLNQHITEGHIEDAIDKLVENNWITMGEAEVDGREIQFYELNSVIVGNAKEFYEDTGKELIEGPDYPEEAGNFFDMVERNMEPEYEGAPGSGRLPVPHGERPQKSRHHMDF